jgi:hypothetical protein
MKLIAGVEITNFRSIRSVTLRDLADFTAFAGLNNTGKSNILRALNAFFSNETDPRVPISVEADYHRRPKKPGKKKVITVALQFSLPDEFRFREKIEHLEHYLGGRQFTISKSWSLGVALPAYFLNGTEVEDPADRQKVDQFLQLVNFRYIPNRVLPVEVVRQEHQALRDVLVRRVRDQGQGGVFDTIRDTSARMIASLSKRLTQVSPDIGTIRLATPQSLADMIFTFGYRLGKDGVEVDDEFQGAGIQSLLMLETLYLIDRDYFQKFGWRQAAVWAIEEPESSLHTSLEAHVAAYLSAIATEANGRLQVLATTHSDLMVQYARPTVIVWKGGGETNCSEEPDPRAALERTSGLGVSRWVHPILHYPVDPIILVDGKYDAAFWDEALKLLGPSRTVRVTYLERLKEGVATGGNLDTLGYVRESVAAIRTRPSYAPVIVVLDWEDTKTANKYGPLFAADDPFAVLAWPEGDANPGLGKRFRGVERFYSDRLMRLAEKRGAPILTKADGTRTVDPEEYEGVKTALWGLVQKGLRETDLRFARAFITTVLERAGALP